MRRVVRLGAVVLACASLAAASPARAQEPAGSGEAVAPSGEAGASEDGASDQAVALQEFREGARLYKERRYREAAAAFERSLRAVWSINAAYNMALSLDRVGDDLAAFEAYRRYLERAEPDDEHRATAQERAEALRLRLGEVQLQLDSPEAIRELRINGEAVTPGAFPRWTEPGPIVVRFVGEAEGQEQEVRGEVRAGGTATIVFPGFPRRESVAVPRPEPDPPTPTPTPTRPRALRAAFWSMIGLTAASGVSIGAFGALTLDYEGRRNNLKESCGVPCDPSLPAEWERKFEAYHKATNAMIGVTVALAVVATALGIAALRERPRSTARARLRWLGPAAEVTF